MKRVERVQGLRRSGAAGPHKGRDPRERLTEAEAIAEGLEDGCAHGGPETGACWAVAACGCRVVPPAEAQAWGRLGEWVAARRSGWVVERGCPTCEALGDVCEECYG